jgi:type VII secretion-associated serine protease mycosin
MSGLAVLLSLAGCLVAEPARAHAPTACTATVAPRPQAAPTGVPWPQQRYDPKRLAGLADGRDVTVAVIDSGVDAHNPQLVGAVQAGTDQLDGGNSVLDCVGHGTGVAGIIAARPVNGGPLRGLAPGATILALRVSELVELEDGKTTGRRGTAAGFAAAIHEAVDRHAKVINLSLVSYLDDPAVREAVQFARHHNVVLVAAAGNQFEEGNRTPYPAAYDGVIGVGAIGPDGQRVPSSQTGPYVDLVAPGSQVVTTATPRGLTVVNGTSFAVPFVAATAALLRQYRPELSAEQVGAQLTATADGGAAGPGYGAGVLNPYRALTERVGASPKPAGPALAPVKADEGAAARAAAERRTMLLAGGGLGLALLVGFIAVVVPRGRRRGWLPGARELPNVADLPEPDRAAPAFGESR